MCAAADNNNTSFHHFMADGSNPAFLYRHVTNLYVLVGIAYSKILSYFETENAISTSFLSTIILYVASS